MLGGVCWRNNFIIRNERDTNMTLEQHRSNLLDRAVEDLSNDAAVLGIYLAGSLAKGDFDAYSDVDLHALVSRENLPEFIKEKYARPKNWGNVLYYESPRNRSAPNIVAHYDCFVKVDYWCECLDDVKPSIWMKHCKVLHDKTGRLAEVINASKAVEYSATADDVLHWREKYLAYVHEAYRNAKRGEYYAALEMIDTARWCIAYGWYAEKGIHINAPWGYSSKIEGERSQLDDSQKAMLADWFCDRDAAKILSTIAEMSPEFFRLNRKLSETIGVDDEADMCRKALELIAE